MAGARVLAALFAALLPLSVAAPDPAYRVVANPRVPGASEAQLPETVKALRIE